MAAAVSFPCSHELAVLWPGLPVSTFCSGCEKARSTTSSGTSYYHLETLEYFYSLLPWFALKSFPCTYFTICEYHSKCFVERDRVEINAHSKSPRQQPLRGSDRHMYTVHSVPSAHSPAPSRHRGAPRPAPGHRGRSEPAGTTLEAEVLSVRHSRREAGV